MWLRRTLGVVAVLAMLLSTVACESKGIAHGEQADSVAATTEVPATTAGAVIVLSLPGEGRTVEELEDPLQGSDVGFPAARNIGRYPGGKRGREGRQEDLVDENPVDENPVEDNLVDNEVMEDETQSLPFACEDGSAVPCLKSAVVECLPQQNMNVHLSFSSPFDGVILSAASPERRGNGEEANLTLELEGVTQERLLVQWNPEEASPDDVNLVVACSPLPPFQPLPRTRPIYPPLPSKGFAVQAPPPRVSVDVSPVPGSKATVRVNFRVEDGGEDFIVSRCSLVSRSAAPIPVLSNGCSLLPSSFGHLAPRAPSPVKSALFTPSANFPRDAQLQCEIQVCVSACPPPPVCEERRRAPTPYRLLANRVASRPPRPALPSLPLRQATPLQHQPAAPVYNVPLPARRQQSLPFVNRRGVVMSPHFILPPTSPALTVAANRQQYFVPLQTRGLPVLRRSKRSLISWAGEQELGAEDAGDEIVFRDFRDLWSDAGESRPPRSVELLHPTSGIKVIGRCEEDSVSVTLVPEKGSSSASHLLIFGAEDPEADDLGMKCLKSASASNSEEITLRISSLKENCPRMKEFPVRVTDAEDSEEVIESAVLRCSPELGATRGEQLDDDPAPRGGVEEPVSPPAGDKQANDVVREQHNVPHVHDEAEATKSQATIQDGNSSSALTLSPFSFLVCLIASAAALQRRL